MAYKGIPAGIVSGSGHKILQRIRAQKTTRESRQEFGLEAKGLQAGKFFCIFWKNLCRESLIDSCRESLIKK